MSLFALTVAVSGPTMPLLSSGVIEVISADQVDEAYERVLCSDVRYRFIIDISTL